MTKQTTVKKPASQDWHPADIKAALEKAGWSCRQLSLHHGLSHSSVAMTLRNRWPRVERIIANALRTTPQVLWPSRYDGDQPIQLKRGPRPQGSGKHTTRRETAYIQTAGAE